ncbi:MAG: mercuric reductase [Verrucomicrobiota bacterium]
MLSPWDTHNQDLVAQVHPSDWKNPTPAPRYNLVVIGAGTAGLVTAAGAAGLGAKVALVEKHLMGGDCLNVGCVPSKAVIRAARAAAEARRAGEFGVNVTGVEVDFAAAMERMRRLRASISPHDSAKRFTELGVDVFFGGARFVDSETVEVAGQNLRFRRAVIATGARPVQPDVPGLRETGFLTNETVFSLTSCPRRLAVIGGGPIGCELAQAFQRLGSQVTLFHNKNHVLDREDADAAAIVQQAIRRDGVELMLNTQFKSMEKKDGAKVIHFDATGAGGSVVVDEILASAGRAPNVEGLNLEGVGVRFDSRKGVLVNDHLQTTNPRIYAAGDICTRWKFTHGADFAARIVIQNALFLGLPFIGRKRLSALNLPWCTYTDPEIAHVGVSEHDARAHHLELDTYTRHFKDVDRAITDGDTEGFVKIHTRKGTGEILGATIVGTHAGDLISEISVAIAAKVGLGRLASVIHPYPTRAEAIRQLGDAFNRTRLTPNVKGLFTKWLSWTR